MGDPEQVGDACDREPCKGSLTEYERRKTEASAAAAACQAQRQAKPSVEGSVAGATSVLLGAAGLICLATGVGAPIGLGLLAAGAAGAAGTGAVALAWRKEMTDRENACKAARDAFLAAKDNVMRNCPARCWPQPFADVNC